jgi:Leucine-rich repeat (LRR) protein
LRGNHFTTLPNSISQLGQLTELDLRENQLTDVPFDTFGNLLHLRKLDLRWNALCSDVGWMHALAARGCIIYI